MIWDIKGSELIFFRIIKFAFTSFMVLTIYDLATMHEKDNETLRNIQSIAVGSVSIFIGIFIMYKFWNRIRITHSESDFIRSCGLFLIFTGIATVIINDKRLHGVL
jgi:hypothetical protein